MQTQSPLPVGWNEHYDHQRQTWYYVDTTQSPPQVSYTRPTPPLPMQWPASRDTWGSSGPQQYGAGPPAVTPIQQPVGLTAAQRLYASSSSKVASNPVSGGHAPNSNPPPPQSAPPFPSLPTPPPSNSPPHSATYAPTIMAPCNPYSSPQSPDATTPTPGFYHTSITHRPPQAHPRGARSPSTSARPSTASGPAHTPSYGGQSSYQATPPSQKHHRSSTFSAGMPSHKRAAEPESTGPKVTPTFSLTARPPPNHANTMSAISTQAPIANPALSVYPTPPQSFIMPGQIGSPPAVPPTALPAQQIYLPIVPQQSIVPMAAAPAPPPKSANKHSNKKAKEFGLAVGKAAGKTVFRVAGNVAAASIGLPPSLGGSIASSIASTLIDGNVASALMNSFSSNNSQDGGGGSADASQLQAVLQGQPDADYQSVINTLLQQQQQQQQAAQPLAVDYQAVIQQLQKIQQQASAQQQQPQILMSAAAAAHNQQALQQAAANPQTAQQAYQQQLQLQQQLQQQQQEQQRIAMAAYQQQLQQQQQQQQASINAINAAQAQQLQQLQLQLAQQQQQQQTLMALQQPTQAPANPTNNWMQGITEAISGPPAGQQPSPLGSLLSNVGQALTGMGNNDSSLGDNSGAFSFNAENLYSSSGDDTSW